MALFDYHCPVACYQTKEATRYSGEVYRRAARLFQLVHDLMPPESAEGHCKIRKGSYSFIAKNTDETSAKIVMYQRGIGRWIVGNEPDWSDGVYIWIRANDESGQAFESAAQDPNFRHRWVLSRIVPDSAVSVAPHPEEHFYYFRLKQDDDETQIAELLVFCSTL